MGENSGEEVLRRESRRLPEQWHRRKRGALEVKNPSTADGNEDGFRGYRSQTDGCPLKVWSLAATWQAEKQVSRFGGVRGVGAIDNHGHLGVRTTAPLGSVTEPRWRRPWWTGARAPQASRTMRLIAKPPAGDKVSVRFILSTFLFS